MFFISLQKNKMFSFHVLEFKRKAFGFFALAPNTSSEVSSLKKK